jgi:hypothetical protein
MDPNPWGRDGDLLQKGLQAFEDQLHNVETSTGKTCSEVVAMCGEDGLNAVHHCAIHGYTDILKCILARTGAGSDGLLRAPSSSGEKPLHLAVLHKQEDCIFLLLKAGSNVSAENKDGKTVLDFVTTPSECAATLIKEDTEYQKRTRARLEWALSLQAAREYSEKIAAKMNENDMRTISGLESDTGKPLNGRICKIMGTDAQTGRTLVRLSPQDKEDAWKKMKPENLKKMTSIEGFVEDKPAGQKESDPGSGLCPDTWATDDERALVRSVMPFMQS